MESERESAQTLLLSMILLRQPSKNKPMFRPGHSGFTFLLRRPFGVTCLDRRPFGGLYKIRDGYRGPVKKLVSHQRSQSTSTWCVLVRKAPTTLKESTSRQSEMSQEKHETSPPGSGVTAAIPLPWKDAVIVKGVVSSVVVVTW